MAKKDKEKSFCKWSEKKIEKRFDELRLLVSHPKYMCMNCARVSVDEKYLCNPTRLNDDE